MATRTTRSVSPTDWTSTTRCSPTGATTTPSSRPSCRGVKVFDANPRIVQLLVERGRRSSARPTSRSPTAIRTAGGATTRSSTGQRRSGSSPWTGRWTPAPVSMPPCAAGRWRRSTVRCSGCPTGAAPASGGWWRTDRTGPSAGSGPGACRCLCCSARAAVSRWSIRR